MQQDALVGKKSKGYGKECKERNDGGEGGGGSITMSTFFHHLWSPSRLTNLHLPPIATTRPSD